MNVQILSDESWFGGASIANHRIKDELEKRGHNVTIHTINEKENTWKGDMSADLYIIANWAYIPKEDLEKLFKEKNIVKFFHDIPGYMYQPKTIKYEHYYKFMQFMIDNALLNIFISPLQLEIYQRYVNIKQDNTMIIPPPKDMNNFSNILKEEDRIYDVLYLGDISNARGIYESIEIAKNNNLDIHFIGPWVDKELVEELKENGFRVEKEIPNDKVSAIMNQYKYFIYLPNIIDSFCFKVVEAELCGCQLIVDPYRIGRYSYTETVEELKEIINTSHEKIVNEMEVRLNARSNE